MTIKDNSGEGKTTCYQYSLKSPFSIKNTPHEDAIDAMLYKSTLDQVSDNFVDVFVEYYDQKPHGLTYREISEKMIAENDLPALMVADQYVIDCIETGYRSVSHNRGVMVDDSSLQFTIELSPDIDDDGIIGGFKIITKELFNDSDGKTDLVRFLSSVLRSKSIQPDDPFFNEFCFNLAQLFDASYIIIGLALNSYDYDPVIIYDRNNQQINSLPVTVFDTNFKHFSKQHLKVFKGDELAGNTWLSTLSAESLINACLLTVDNESIGCVQVIGAREYQLAEQKAFLLDIFAQRIVSEMKLNRLTFQQFHHSALYRELIDVSPSGMYVMDIEPPLDTRLPLDEQVNYIVENARFSFCNSTYLEFQNLKSLEDIYGYSLLDMGKDEDIKGYIRYFISSGYQLNEMTYQYDGPDADKHDIWLTASAKGRVRGNFLHKIVGINNNVTDLVKQRELLSYQANHDHLTGLINRNCFGLEVEKIIKRLHKNDESEKHFAVFILDLDGFKEINDTLGHSTGDKLLQQIGPRIRKVTKNDKLLLSRLGGDEFGWVMLNPKSDADIINHAIEVIEAIRKPFTIDDLDLRVGASVGVSLYPEHGRDFSSLMRCADIAMYQSKNNLRDFSLYNPDVDYYSVRRLSLMMDLRDAIEDNQLVLHYQPIIDFKNNQVKGFEALVRWQHPVHGMLSPGEFIPLIELTDMIEPLTWWVIEMAMRQLREWQSEGKLYSISVNVSAQNLTEDGFMERLQTLMDRYDIIPSSLEMEITESTLMADPVKAHKVITEVANLGVTFAIDDYGTGYSSLAYLKSLPVSTLKIDRAFISQMSSDEQDNIIVNSTIQLAHNLGMKVTAEGIEDPMSIDELCKMNCDRGQGFLFCRPIPVEKIDPWLTTYHKDMLSNRFSSLF